MLALTAMYKQLRSVLACVPLADAAVLSTTYVL
jgi:hypothetical protein